MALILAFYGDLVPVFAAPRAPEGVSFALSGYGI